MPILTVIDHISEKSSSYELELYEIVSYVGQSWSNIDNLV